MSAAPGLFDGPPRVCRACDGDGRGIAERCPACDGHGLVTPARDYENEENARLREQAERTK